MTAACKDHIKAMLRIMKYCNDKPDRGWTLKLSRRCNGKDKSFRKILKGKSDSNYASCKETQHSVSGYVIYLEDSLISVRSGMQKFVALSVAKAELIALVQCVQELMFIKRLLESMKPLVQLPMIIEVDNKASLDLVNGWSTGGGTNSEMKVMYLRELKEKGIIRVYWHPTKENKSDIYTKNVENTLFEKHTRTLCCEDQEENVETVLVAEE